jgi:serine/threonine protein kinase
VGESDIDHATDIWAMGVVLFEMVTAAHPFVAPGYHALLARIADDPPAPLPPRVAEPLRRVIDRCLQKRRADRYGDAGALRRALEETFASIDIAHAGGLVIESARVLSSASRDSSGHALAVASPPAKAPPRRAIHKHWAFIGVVSLCAVAASVLTWRQLARVPDDSALVPSAPASPPPQAQPATTAVVAPATLTTPASTGDPAPSAAPSSARATSQKARSPAKPVKKTTSRSTHVDGPGF